jgi:hypothetical protein
MTLTLDANGVIWAENNLNKWYMVSGTGWALESTGPTTAPGQAANLTGAVTTLDPVQIDTTTPTVSSLIESPSTGDLNAGNVVTLTLTMSEAVNVNITGGPPTLMLNDGGTATYTGGSGSTALTFSYTVAAGQNTSALAATAVNLNAATITDGAGNAANLSLSGLIQTGPQIGTTVPSPPVITSDTLNANNSVTLTGTAEAAATVTVYEGTTSLGSTTANASGAGQASAPSQAVDPIIGGKVLADPTIVTQNPRNGLADIGNNTEINTRDSGEVTFTGTNGALRLDPLSTCTGKVSGFRAQNTIDLPGIAFDAQTTPGHSPNSNGMGGALSVTDGAHCAKIALLSNYIASFTRASDNHGGTMVVAEPTQSENQSLLAHPQHT